MNGSRPVYVSTGALAGKTVAEALAAATRLGLGAVELSSGMPHDPAAAMTATAARQQFKLLVHNYFPAPADPFVLNLAAADPAVLDRSRAHARAAMDLSAKLGAPFYAAHAGFMMQPQVSDLGRPFGTDAPLTPRADALALFTDSVRDLLAYGRGLGVGFLVENNVVAPFNAPNGRNDRLLLADPDEMLAFAAAIDDPGFGYLLDTGHLQVSARTLGFDLDAAMTALAPYIRAFHLSDNDGAADTNEPFGPDAWFLPWLRTCADAAVVIELRRVPDAALAACLDAVGPWL